MIHLDENSGQSSNRGATHEAPGVAEAARGRPRTLADTRLFEGVGPDCIRAFDSRSLWTQIPAGAWVIDPDIRGTDVYFILRGQAQVVVAGAGREIILGDLSAGDFTGELSAIDGKPRSGGIRAVTNVSVAHMSAAAFRDAIDRFPIVRDRVLARLAVEVRGLIDRNGEQANLGVRARLCAQLLRFARPGVGGRLVVSPPPTHAELAARIGARREVVTKLLSGLRRDGLVARSRGALTLLAPEALRQIVNDPERGHHHL
jgi:CRP/FNR family transcriptional regulator, cyclic AMP receptor protein